MKEKQQLNLILLHIGLGFLMAFYPLFSKIYAILIVLIGFYFVVKHKNRNNEILYVIAYIAGSEVFLRATYGNPFHEFGKYFMLFFTLLGFFYSGLPRIKNPYWIYLLLLLPSIYVSFLYVNGDLRRKIFFEILGPICMGVLVLYNYKRKISTTEINAILNSIALPIFTFCVYLLLKFSQNVYSIDSNNSNYYFSGNYAPNQLSTVLGLGLFIYLLKIVIESDSKKFFYVNVIVFCLILNRELLTFSRGGFLTGVIVILSLFLSLYICGKGCYKLKRKISILLLFIITSVFILTLYQTDNALSERYLKFEIFDSNKNFKKKGRYIQIKSDIKNFIENPIVGIGVGKGKEIRKFKYNKNVSTHNEITRLLSEHGILGFFSLLILFFCPLRLYFNSFQNFYLLPFFIFWLFTINHSATRIIAPLFIYSLTLLQIKFANEEDSIRAYQDFKRDELS